MRVSIFLRTSRLREIHQQYKVQHIRARVPSATRLRSFLPEREAIGASRLPTCGYTAEQDRSRHAPCSDWLSL